MIRIGTSGWSYDHWTDVLYPAGLPVSKAGLSMFKRLRGSKAMGGRPAAANACAP